MKHSTSEYVKHMLCSVQIITRTHSQNDLRLGLRLITLLQDNFNEPLERVCKLPAPFNCPICKGMHSHKFELIRSDKTIVCFHNSIAALMHITILIDIYSKDNRKTNKRSELYYILRTNIKHRFVCKHMLRQRAHLNACTDKCVYWCV